MISEKVAFTFFLNELKPQRLNWESQVELTNERVKKKPKTSLSTNKVANVVWISQAWICDI